MKSMRGFTLLEVLVALAIFAVAGAALMQVSQSQLMLTRQIEDKTFAHWVALNQISEMQSLQDWPSIGEEKTRVSMASREWLVTVKTSGTSAPRMRRVDILVALAPDANDQNAVTVPVTQLSAFIDQPHTTATTNKE